VAADIAVLQGLAVPPDRQYSHFKETLTVFPENQTDPFIIYCKASIVMARVKNFCLRYKALQSSGDPMYKIPDDMPDIPVPCPNPLCFKATPAFLELNNTIQVMKTSFPAHIKNVMRDGKLDMYAYSALNILHL
jgi:hypothetical protein